MKKKMSHIAALTSIAALFLVGCTSTPEVTEAPQDDVAESVAEEEAEEPAAEVGTTRENPAPLGTEITDGDWKVAVNSVDLDATDAVLSNNELNDAPEDGNVYILPNVTITYLGDEAQGMMPMAVFSYVTADGNSIDEDWQDAPDGIDTISELYKDASTTGNLVFSVPSSVDGVLAVTPDMMSEKVFVAIK